MFSHFADKRVDLSSASTRGDRKERERKREREREIDR